MRRHGRTPDRHSRDADNGFASIALAGRIGLGAAAWNPALVTQLLKSKSDYDKLMHFDS